LVTNGHAHAYVLLFLLFVAVSLVATAIRRRHDEGFPDRWLDGFTTCLKEVISVAKSGELPTRKPNWIRNLLVSAWMIFGMALLAYITSSVASAMTMASLRQRGEIHELGDLPGHTVAVLSGSGAETHLPGLGIRVVSYGNRDAAAAAVLAGETDAFVADTAVLEYWAAEHSDARVSVTGRPFKPYKFAFATSRDQPALADRLSVAIIDLAEAGLVEQIRSRYFGRSVDRSAGDDHGTAITIPPLFNLPSGGQVE
ncbi:MAG: transporter substrate-binding domain-containing protein, partial [Planctomycetes bacterium]|nr:transporter substrate-binding domain-containing protein [Planctomycetota bacterium]